MYSNLPNLIIGFHGCDTNTYENVIYKHERLHASHNSYDWLGSGIYFWENSLNRAQEWAASYCERYNRKHPDEKPREPVEYSLTKPVYSRKPPFRSPLRKSGASNSSITTHPAKFAQARLAKPRENPSSNAHTAATRPNMFMKVLYRVTFSSPIPRKNPCIPLVRPGRKYIHAICRRYDTPSETTRASSVSVKSFMMAGAPVSMARHMITE